MSRDNQAEHYPVMRKYPKWFFISLASMPAFLYITGLSAERPDIQVSTMMLGLCALGVLVGERLNIWEHKKLDISNEIADS